MQIIIDAPHGQEELKHAFTIYLTGVRSFEELKTKMNAFNNSERWSIIQSKTDQLITLYVYYLYTR